MTCDTKTVFNSDTINKNKNVLSGKKNSKQQTIEYCCTIVIFLFFFGLFDVISFEHQPSSFPISLFMEQIEYKPKTNEEK